jgi:hypothetical protein
MEKESVAEDFAHPSYKWIGERRIVTNMQNWRISNFLGGIGFSFYNYSDKKALKVVLKVYREDGVCEFYIIDTYYCGEWGDNLQKWQTHQLPLFPYESCHGRIKYIKFSYIIHKDGKSIPSKYDYKFAILDDFHRGWADLSDFHDLYFKTENNYTTYELNREEIQHALYRINNEYNDLLIRPSFTRGNTWGPAHPIHEIHRHIDRVIEKKKNDPKDRHFIHMAIFDFDTYHVAEHLIYAKENGVDVECIADWASVSSINCVENIAKMRRAGIPIYGVVRNTPYNPSEGIASMHTKFIIFDGEIVHSSSYNLHFHLWGGNWENGLVYYSRDFALLYSNIYNAIRGGVIQTLHVKPKDRYNLYYSFGSYRTSSEDFYRPQDAIVTEINNARRSITVVMFDMDYLTGISNGHETDVITALINARNRGIRVKIILNGMIAHTGPLPEPWDKYFRRLLKRPIQSLKDAWMEVAYVYYWESIYSPLHHKFAVFDDNTVITESYNWYTTSIYSDEVLSVIRDKRIAREFIDEANKLCESFRLGRE